MSLMFAQRFRPSLDYPYYSSMNKWRKSCARIFAFRMIKRGETSVIERKKYFCNLWACDQCGPTRAVRLREELIRKAKEHGLNIALDLTLSPAVNACPVDSFRRIKKVWGKFRHAVNRLPGKKFEFAWGLGVTKAGEAHLHCLINKHLEQKLVCELWQKSGGGPICHIKKVADIVPRSDYMASGLLAGGFLRRSRRYGCSKGIKLTVQPSVAPWQVVPEISDLDSFARAKRILKKRCNQDGKIVFCVVKERPYHAPEEE